MTEDEKSDDGLFAMIKKAMNPRQEAEPAEERDLPEAEDEDSIPVAKPAPETAAAKIAEPVDKPEFVATSSSEPTVTNTQSRTRTAEQVQKMIVDALSRIPDAPKNGMTITVYGYRPWNAMVTFAPGSAKISTATMIRSTLTRLVEEMRGSVDIEMPPH